MGIMFGKKSEKNDQYYEGLGKGEAKAYSMIHDVIERNMMEDPKAVLIAIKVVCEHELLDNPYIKNVTLFKLKPKEL